MSCDELERVAVVVIGRNEGERLARCLRSIREADYPQERISLIYVDSASTDQSAEVAGKLGAQVVTIRLARPTAAAARNAGRRIVAERLVHFLDGDTILHREWLKKAVRAMADPTVACVFGRREEIARNATVFNFWAHHDWYVEPGPARSCAGDALFRRDVLERAGGFDESLIAGEEPDLCFRIRHDQGLIILCLDEPMTLHDINMTRFGQYWKRCARTGHAYAEVGGRHPELVSWRRSRLRNVIHVVVGMTALALSIGLWSPWPAIVWTVLLSAAVVRNAYRCRERVGTLRGAILYSLHHYLAKLPMAIGQMDFWIRQAARRTPRSLIEYRNA